MREQVIDLGRKFARVVTNAVVARPALWRVFRGPLRAQFDALARHWETMRAGSSLRILDEGLAHVDGVPRRILDLGTGTGIGARLLAERFPEAEIVGVDLSPKMVEEARSLVAADLAERVRFEVADAARLPYSDGAFDLVVLLNMIPFFDELGRVTTSGGHVLFGFSSGAQTPIFVPLTTLRERLAAVGFDGFRELAVDEELGFLARRAGPV